jgi:hypothetical protein
MADMAAKGRQRGGAKLTVEQVISIRADDRLQRVIAAEYGVARKTISMIKCRKNWKEI